jgi:hypothetical protein
MRRQRKSARASQPVEVAVVVVVVVVPPPEAAGEPFPLETPTAMAATAAAPRTSQVMVLSSIWAFLTPAGAPGTSGPVSAAKAAELATLNAKISEIKRMSQIPAQIVSRNDTDRQHSGKAWNLVDCQSGYSNLNNGVVQI